MDTPDPSGRTPAGHPSLSGKALAAAPRAWIGSPEVSLAPGTDTVLLTRMLTFRNFAGLPFVASAPPHACALIADKALDFVAKQGGLTVWRLADCPPRVIRLLREREILPQRALSFPGKKGFKYLAASPGGESWTLVNEVEHVTCGRIFPGCAPEASEACFAPPAESADRSPWAWSRRFGYLASDPARIGPGFAVEAVAHLPGLALSRRLLQARNYLTAAGVGFLAATVPSPHAVSPGAADAGLFRLASRGGLGRAPREVYQAFLNAIGPVLRREREARERCLENHRKRLEERTHHSLQRLIGADSLTYAELLAAGSLVRLGAALGLANVQIPGILEELRVTAASGHLAVTSGRDLSKEEEDFARANVVRLSLRMHSGEIS